MTASTTDDVSEQNLNLQHLQAELGRLDILIRHEVRRWRLAGQDPADNFRGLYVSDADVDRLLTRPFATPWGQTVSLPPAEQQLFREAESQIMAAIQIISKQAEQQGLSLRLNHLQTVFGLSRFELDTLLICLAPSLDLRYERVYSYLQDDVTRKRPTVNLILDILGQSGPARLPELAYFTAEAPLFKYKLLERQAPGGEADPLLNQTLTVDEALLAWLLGNYHPHADLNPYATLLSPQRGGETDYLLVGDRHPDLAYIAANKALPLVVFYGVDQLAQRAAARLLTAQLRRSLLLVDIGAIVKADTAPAYALRMALRDARLTGAIPCLLGWDACLLPDGQLSVDLLTELCAYPDWIIVAGQTRWQAEGVDRQRPLFWVDFSGPTYSQRLSLWRHFLGEEAWRTGGSEEWESNGVDQPQNRKSEIQNLKSEIDIPGLAGQFILTTGQIRDTIASARDEAARRGEPMQNQDLFVAARAHSNPRLATLARKIVPRYGWADIVLPPDQKTILWEIIATVRGRPLVLEQWGVGQKLASSAAVSVLFAGDPGTGKTMAAEVIAGELKLDLYKIDLSTMVSKYIGETEKNLEKIFSEAESSNAILFFDEADAIFGKRSEVKDAHDRYANIEVSYLLQRMESYDGVTILATNLRANLDEAFTRRLQFAVDFPFPEKEDRLRIWQTLFPPDVPRDPDLDFTVLAKRFKLAGGNIRNIIVSAAFQAAADGGQVTMRHLFHGTRRELQKMGRLIGEEDLRM